MFRYRPLTLALLAALLTLFTAVRAQRRLTSVAEPAATPVPATRRNLNV